MPRPIVIATDLSAHADEALRYARRFAEAGRPLHLLHVFAWMSPETYGLTLGELEKAERHGRLPQVVTARLSHQATRAGLLAEALTLAYRRHLAVGPAIAQYAGEVGADLVVVGTHGRRGLRRLVLGSVAEEVLRTAPCDVLAVPLDETAPWSGRRVRRVLAPVDFSEATEAHAARAARVARALGAETLDLLHVVEPFPYATWMLPEGEDTAPEVARRVRQALARLAARVGPEAPTVHTEQAVGAAAREIVRRAAEQDADLLVVASHNPRGLDRLLLGSVSERVLRTAERPVLVVRAEAPVEAVEVEDDYGTRAPLGHPHARPPREAPTAAASLPAP